MDPGLNPIQRLTVWIVPLVLAFTMHEAAHAYAAYWCGDRTGYQQGRVSLNPTRHLDPFGSILMPAIGIFMGGWIFGWAKPTPIRLPPTPHWRRDQLLVTLAGPFANLILLILSLALLYVVPMMPDAGRTWLQANLVNSAFFNALMVVLNLLPVPGFDGGHVMAAVLPRRLGEPFERYASAGPFIFLVLFMLVPMVMQAARVGPDPFRILVALPAQFLEQGMARLVGLG